MFKEGVGLMSCINNVPFYMLPLQYQYSRHSLSFIAVIDVLSYSWNAYIYIYIYIYNLYTHKIVITCVSGTAKFKIRFCSSVRVYLSSVSTGSGAGASLLSTKLFPDGSSITCGNKAVKI